MTSNNKPNQINFSMNVSANDLDPEDDNFKIKVVLDFVPAFSNGNNSGATNFNANTVHRLLTFISDRVIKKVVESVYYDRENKDYAQAKKLKLPANYDDAIKIYDERRQKKKGNGDTSHLNIREREADSPDGNCIECIVNEFFKTDNRPVWADEENVTRIIFEQQSPPSLTVESRTIINGDKRPK